MGNPRSALNCCRDLPNRRIGYAQQHEIGVVVTNGYAPLSKPCVQSRADPSPANHHHAGEHTLIDAPMDLTLGARDARPTHDPTFTRSLWSARVRAARQN